MTCDWLLVYVSVWACLFMSNTTTAFPRFTFHLILSCTPATEYIRLIFLLRCNFIQQQIVTCYELLYFSAPHVWMRVAGSCTFYLYVAVVCIHITTYSTPFLSHSYHSFPFAFYSIIIMLKCGYAFVFPMCTFFFCRLCGWMEHFALGSAFAYQPQTHIRQYTRQADIWKALDKANDSVYGRRAAHKEK